jgi:ubiquinone biosynthesis monooxygenase Coq7
MPVPFAIGALAGALGDRTSLGFVAETERQVESHLRGHMQRLARPTSAAAPSSNK